MIAQLSSGDPNSYKNVLSTRRAKALCGKHDQMENMAGAAHLPNDYAGVLR